MDKFIPVKITDDQWANRFLDGEVFMRPLHEFGIWGRMEQLDNDKINNAFRGDIHEGVNHVFSKTDDCEIMENIAPEVKDIAKNICTIDEDDIPYFKVFCLYCFEYEPLTDFFRQPDPRLKAFGDTAVIIIDFREFIERLAFGIFAKWEKNITLMNRVTFYDFNKTQAVNCLFEKHISYAYQKELRIATAELKKDCFSRNSDPNKQYRLVRSLYCEKIQIGSIRDIAIKIPIHDFLNLRLPAGFRCKWPMSDDPRKPSNYDKVVADTIKTMKNYHSHYSKLIFSI